MAQAGSSRFARFLPLLACLACFPGVSPGAETPPPQHTRLRFQKTLSIHSTPRGRVFSETRRTGEDDTLTRILGKEYGVTGDTVPALTEAFRILNPGLDPDHLPPGQTVRIPFKLEENPTPAPAPPPSSAPPEQTHTVRRGESLWRILKNRFKVPRDAMSSALAAVAQANRTLRNLDHLVEGQRLLIPGSVSAKPPLAPVPAPGPAAAAPSTWTRTLFALLEDFGCRISTAGETFLPLARGRTIRLDDREFPVITAPGGRRVIFDPSSRMSVALTRAVEEAWGYSVLQGTDPDAETTLSKLLPRLGFHEVAEGPRTIPIGAGVLVTAHPRWTLIARPSDPWEGRVHLIFPAGTRLDPDLSALVLQAGFSIHSLGGEPGPVAEEPGDSAPELSFAEPGSAEGAVLGALGVTHQVHPDVECDLGGGVRYHLRPDLTFDHDGTAYAVPPREPRQAEALLTRAGYFTVPLPDPSDPFDRLRDLLALLRIRSQPVALRVPRNQGLELSVKGSAFEAPPAARSLYPRAAAETRPNKILLTEARVPPHAARLLLREGFAPWIIRRPGAREDAP